MKHSTNTAVNWPVFQATAALYGGYLAAGRQPVSGMALGEKVDRSFVNLYRVMLGLAQRIEQEDGGTAAPESAPPSGAAG